MDTNLEIIEKNCGNQPENQEFYIVGNDPDFIFVNDPNFESLRLFDIEGNIINVNSGLNVLTMYMVDGVLITIFLEIYFS